MNETKQTMTVTKEDFTKAVQNGVQRQKDHETQGAGLLLLFCTFVMFICLTATQGLGHVKYTWVFGAPLTALALFGSAYKTPES
jgi:hypothetical protein